jgi:hypothetical protein
VTAEHENEKNYFLLPRNFTFGKTFSNSCGTVWVLAEELLAANFFPRHSFSLAVPVQLFSQNFPVLQCLVSDEERAADEVELLCLLRFLPRTDLVATILDTNFLPPHSFFSEIQLCPHNFLPVLHGFVSDKGRAEEEVELIGPWLRDAVVATVLAANFSVSLLGLLKLAS